MSAQYPSLCTIMGEPVRCRLLEGKLYVPREFGNVQVGSRVTWTGKSYRVTEREATPEAWVLTLEERKIGRGY